MEKYKEGIKYIGDAIGPGCLRTSVIILGIITSILFACNDNGKINPGTKPPSPVPVPIDTIKTPDGKDSVIYESERLSLAQPAYATVNMGDNAEANYYILRAYLDSLPHWGTVNLPAGNLQFSKKIEINKPVYIRGSGYGTKIIGSFKVLPGAGGSISDFELYSDGSPNGIEISGITHLENIKIFRSPGNGISIKADVESGKSNASQSTFRNVEVIECKGNGFYMHGGDVNGMGFYDCSARDNGGVGFYDDSFLGNTFVNCMGHSNKGGHYVAENGNNRSTFIGCYGEEDSPPSRFGGISRVTGGLLGYEVTPDLKFYKGTTKAYKGTGGYVITSAYAKVDTQ